MGAMVFSSALGGRQPSNRYSDTFKPEQPDFGDLFASVFCHSRQRCEVQDVLAADEDSLLSFKEEQDGKTVLPKSPPRQRRLKLKRSNSSDSPSSSPYVPSPHEIAEAESEDTKSNNNKEVGSRRSKATLLDEEKLERRKQINRDSARRIRAKRNRETADLKQQNAIKQQQIEGLLRQNDCLMQENQDLVKDKALLLQQSIELTERWQRAAGELLEMRSQVSHFSPTTTASWGAGLVALEDAQHLAYSTCLPTFSIPQHEAFI